MNRPIRSGSFAKGIAVATLLLVWSGSAALFTEAAGAGQTRSVVRSSKAQAKPKMSGAKPSAGASPIQNSKPKKHSVGAPPFKPTSPRSAPTSNAEGSVEKLAPPEGQRQSSTQTFPAAASAGGGSKALEVTGQSQSSRILMMLNEDDGDLEAIRARRDYRDAVERLTP